MTRKISASKIYIGLWEEFKVPTERRVKFIEHLRDCPGEWAEVKEELLMRCERGDMRICGMGFIDEVRRERKAAGGKDFVVNNNWSPMYCRLFVLTYPEYKNRFRFRELKEAA